MQASMVSASRNSMRATGTPDWMVRITLLTASSMVGNEHTADDIASGMPYRRRRISVITASVPSEPTSSRVRS